MMFDLLAVIALTVTAALAAGTLAFHVARGSKLASTERRRAEPAADRALLLDAAQSIRPPRLL
jgi:hypothetical protein